MMCKTMYHMSLDYVKQRPYSPFFHFFLILIIFESHHALHRKTRSEKLLKVILFLFFNVFLPTRAICLTRGSKVSYRISNLFPFHDAIMLCKCHM
ncbi:hypothetical protein F4805DRAFT_361066 [Annulohypoxylon moriforme]|nr:hypothetical protein F4805DRAFT_361066 [Annulohypoxylon moriforme]